MDISRSDGTAASAASIPSIGSELTDRTNHSHAMPKLPGRIVTPIENDALVPKGLPTWQGIPAWEVLQHTAEQLPDRTAVVYGDLAWTYQQLNHDAIRAAAMLQQMGVSPGDRVGLLLPNVPEYIIAANAIWRAGGIVLAISPLMVAKEIDALLEKTGCRIVITLDMLSQNVTDEDVRLFLVSIREHLPSLQQVGYLWKRMNQTGQWTLPTNERNGWFWEAVEAVESCAQPWTPVSIDAGKDTAWILPTGGTTGTPKPVALSHSNLVVNAWQQYQWTDGSFGTETLLGVIPFFHSYGMSAIVMGGTAMGATLVLHHRFQTRQIIRLIEQHRPTVFHAVPAMLVALNERFRSSQPNVEGLRWVISGGSALDEATAAEFHEHTNALVVEGYGLSEASPVTHVGHLFSEPRYGTIGLPLPLTECRIVDVDDGDVDVPDGEVGELLIRGPQVMLGYWNDPETTRIAIRNGWLYTGDLAMRDVDGIYRIVGRKKDLIITNGFNVYPIEIETALCLCEGVQEAAVIGVPDDRRGENVKAFIVMEQDHEFDRDKLREHCEEHLSSYKRPREYECRDGALPRNFQGKIIRRELRGES